MFADEFAAWLRSLVNPLGEVNPVLTGVVRLVWGANGGATRSTCPRLRATGPPFGNAFPPSTRSFRHFIPTGNARWSVRDNGRAWQVVLPWWSTLPSYGFPFHQVVSTRPYRERCLFWSRCCWRRLRTASHPARLSPKPYMRASLFCAVDESRKVGRHGRLVKASHPVSVRALLPHMFGPVNCRICCCFCAMGISAFCSWPRNHQMVVVDTSPILKRSSCFPRDDIQ